MTGQNTSSAVKQQRHEKKDSLDFFPTPAWATRALCEHIIIPRGTVYEPACGNLHMVKPLKEYFDKVFYSDIEEREHNNIQHDFLMPYLPRDFKTEKFDNVITNPPFTLAEEFIKRSRMISRTTCMIARTSFAEGKGRYLNLFKDNPPDVVAQFVERVPMVKGRTDAKISSATSYAWFVWLNNDKRVYDKVTEFQWIPPCRKKLERPEDYF